MDISFRCCIGLILTLDLTIALAADPADTPPAAATFASDEGRLDGDHLKLRVNVDGFELLGDKDARIWCAPKGSKVKVTKHTDDYVFVFFKSVPRSDKVKEKPGAMASGEAATSAALKACNDRLVNDYEQYKIKPGVLGDHAFRRTGVMFGALVVPFKFHLGSDSKLSASSTIAPYVGFRGPAPYGLTFTPVVSAGLGLVPVANPTTSETETKSAFSTAVGVLLTHSKNEKFNAGLLFGKDFLSNSDRAGDKSIDNVWFSLYAGYSL